MTKAKTPTLEQFRAYQAAYDYFNAALFGGELKPCLLNFRGRHKRNMGLFWPKRWGRLDGSVTHEIALNPDVLLRPLVQTMATLVHEMCHQWQQDHGRPSRAGYHDKEWGRKMEVVGLTPTNTGEPGGKRTGQQMTHHIEPDGPFQKAFEAMPAAVALPWLSGGLPDAPKPPSKNKNKVKYVCSCGTPVWGKAGLTVLCGECEMAFAQLG
jgi:predicted SprT family Zn-dependent metalloprotease